MRTGRGLPILLALLTTTPTALAARQAPAVWQTPSARLVSFTNEPTEPEFGEVFKLTLTVRLAPGVVVFFPDTLLAATSSFSAGKGSWNTTPAPADSIDVRATYPVMGLMNGGVELPSLELWARPAGPGESPGPRPTSDLPPPASAATAGLERAVIPVGGALIIPLREMAAAEVALTPRPAADVEGRQWSAGLAVAIGLLVVAASLLVWLLATSRKGAEPHATEPLPPALTRADALRELDRIREMGWHANGRIVDFYDATTGVLRRYTEQEEPEWRTALTSSELVERLRGRWGRGAVDELGSAVWAAERVKFGEYRPGSEAAENHWATVRDWVAHTPQD
jgi:hypothetical protein